MLGLEHPYLQVADGIRLSYGGNQMRADSAAIRKCGCGPVAALDTVWYLEHRGESVPIPLSDYNAQLAELCRSYFPLLPPFGINGISFTVGLNRLLRDRQLPYSALWMVSGARLWIRAEEMLERDLPVILTVGPNFPVFWQNNRLPFYIKASDGSYRRSLAAKGHFVTATGIDADWVRISSWGREHYINRTEYQQYTKQSSSFLFSNLVYLREE